MSRKQFRRIVGFILTALLIVGTLMIAASTAAAQRRARRSGHTTSRIQASATLLRRIDPASPTVIARDMAESVKL